VLCAAPAAELRRALAGLMRAAGAPRRFRSMVFSAPARSARPARALRRRCAASAAAARYRSLCATAERAQTLHAVPSLPAPTIPARLLLPTHPSLFPRRCEPLPLRRIEGDHCCPSRHRRLVAAGRAAARASPPGAPVRVLGSGATAGLLQQPGRGGEQAGGCRGPAATCCSRISSRFRRRTLMARSSTAVSACRTARAAGWLSGVAAVHRRPCQPRNRRRPGRVAAHLDGALWPSLSPALLPPRSLALRVPE
jgi:hypothetical protein